MASAKQKRIVARLEQIKDEAAQANARGEDAGLAEEAAGLALELNEILTTKKEK